MVWVVTEVIREHPNYIPAQTHHTGFLLASTWRNLCCHVFPLNTARSSDVSAITSSPPSVGVVPPKWPRSLSLMTTALSWCPCFVILFPQCSICRRGPSGGWWQSITFCGFWDPSERCYRTNYCGANREQGRKHFSVLRQNQSISGQFCGKSAVFLANGSGEHSPDRDSRRDHGSGNTPANTSVTTNGHFPPNYKTKSNIHQNATIRHTLFTGRLVAKRWGAALVSGGVRVLPVPVKVTAFLSFSHCLGHSDRPKQLLCERWRRWRHFCKVASLQDTAVKEPPPLQLVFKLLQLFPPQHSSSSDSYIFVLHVT